MNRTTPYAFVLPAALLIQACAGGAPPAQAVPEEVVSAESAVASGGPLSDERAMELGRVYIALVHAGEIEQLWEHMAPEARERIGSYEEFRAGHERVASRLGAEISVVRETVEPASAGMIASRMYTRVSNYSGMPGRAVRIVIGLTDAGTIGGMRAGPAE